MERSPTEKDQRYTHASQARCMVEHSSTDVIVCWLNVAMRSHKNKCLENETFRKFTAAPHCFPSIREGDTTAFFATLVLCLLAVLWQYKSPSLITWFVSSDAQSVTVSTLEPIPTVFFAVEPAKEHSPETMGWPLTATGGRNCSDCRLLSYQCVLTSCPILSDVTYQQHKNGRLQWGGNFCIVMGRSPSTIKTQVYWNRRSGPWDLDWTLLALIAGDKIGMQRGHSSLQQRLNTF